MIDPHLSRLQAKIKKNNRGNECPHHPHEKKKKMKPDPDPHHYGRTGFVLRQAQFPETAPRSAPEVPDIVCDLHERDCEGVQSSRCLDDGVVSCQGFELFKHAEVGGVNFSVSCEGGPSGCGGGDTPTLFGAVLNSRPVILEISSATFTSKPFLVLRPFFRTKFK